jgi:hypothetical protein
MYLECGKVYCFASGKLLNFHLRCVRNLMNADIQISLTFFNSASAFLPGIQIQFRHNCIMSRHTHDFIIPAVPATIEPHVCVILSICLNCAFRDHFLFFPNFGDTSNLIVPKTQHSRSRGIDTIQSVTTLNAFNPSPVLHRTTVVSPNLPAFNFTTSRIATSPNVVSI